MSSVISPHIFEVVVTRPSKVNPQTTREKNLAGIALQRQHADFIGVPLEGLKVEDDNFALKVLEWTTYEGHMDNFRNSPLYPEFVKLWKEANIGLPYMSHYNFFGPLPVTPMPPVVEYFAFLLKPGILFDQFLDELTKALQLNVKALGFAVGRQVEDSNRILILVAYESVEAHMVDLPRSPDFEPFRAGMAQVYEKYLVDGAAGREKWHVKTCEPGMAV